MTAQKFQTNLNCGSCVAAVKQHLDNDPAIRRWSVDTDDPKKVLTVEGEDVSPERVEHHVASAGFKVLGRIAQAAYPESAGPRSFAATYWPVLLVIAYVLGLVAVMEYMAGHFDGRRAMANFMGGFFVAFSFFKLLDLRGFVASFQSYDVLARLSRAYGYLYPFVELSLGVAYLVRLAPVVTNAITLVVMLVGIIGVAQALFRKQRIQCACLGTVFKLPMSTVAFVEDALMAVMALVMLA